MAVQRQDLASPCDLVGNALTGRLRVRPQFQVARAIVVALAILVVDLLVWAEGAPELLRHDEAMLKNRASPAATLEIHHRTEELPIPSQDRFLAENDVTISVDPCLGDALPRILMRLTSIDKFAIGASDASACESLRPSEIASQKRMWVPFFSLAIWADNPRTGLPFTIKKTRLAIRDDGRMFRQGFHVEWSRHGLMDKTKWE